MRFIPVIILMLTTCFATALHADEFSDFATEVVDFSGSFGPSPYDEPNAILGKPATQCQNIPGPWGGGIFHVKLVEPAYNVDLGGNKVITSIYPTESITVKFDHKVVDYPGNLYGEDLIVFGNSFFVGTGDYVNDTTDLRQYMLTTGVFSEPVTVSVSQDGITWHEFTSGPFTDDYYPTQACVWDPNLFDQTGNGWTDEEMDFTKPVDPDLSAADFEYISTYAAIQLYDGSGGGTAFDLQDLTSYSDLEVDEETGYRWIQYIKLSSNYQGEIDAVSDVTACGDPTHPYPLGDINEDCSVDLKDFALMAQNWLVCTYDCD